MSLVATSGMPVSREICTISRFTTRLLGDPVVLHLQVEAVRPEQLAVVLRARPGLGVLAVEDGRRDVTGQAGAQRDQSLVVAFQQLVVDARLVIEAFGVSQGAEREEVRVPGEVAGQEHEVVVAHALLGSRLLQARAGRHVDFRPEDGLDALRPALLVEGKRPEHVAVIGEGEGGHPQAFARATSASIEEAPSRREKSEWQCRCTNGVTCAHPSPLSRIPGEARSVNTAGRMIESPNNRSAREASHGVVRGTEVDARGADSAHRGSPPGWQARGARSSRTGRRTACARWTSPRAAASASPFFPAAAWTSPLPRTRERASVSSRARASPRPAYYDERGLEWRRSFYAGPAHHLRYRAMPGRPASTRARLSASTGVFPTPRRRTSASTRNGRAMSSRSV